MEKKKRQNKKYSAEFKKRVILDMRQNYLSYGETVKRYNLGNPNVGGLLLMLHRVGAHILRRR